MREARQFISISGIAGSRVDPKHLDVHVEGDLLTIKAERKAEEKEPEYRETYYGKFERTVTLPREGGEKYRTL